MEDLAEIRRLISLYARRKDSRVIPNNEAMPCVWKNWEVENFLGIVFTPEAAWKYIADLAEDNHPIEVIILDKPKGETAYVMKVDLGNSGNKLYIKIQIKKNKIWGRSFHYST